MPVVCAWCNSVIGGEGALPDPNQPISHGICAECAHRVMSRESGTLYDLLNRFAGPVIAVDGDARVLSANRDGFTLLDKTPAASLGLLGGEAFECRHAREPGGCGGTIHCKSCVIRLTVMDTWQSGRSQVRVPAYADIGHIIRDRQVRFLISTERVGEVVLLRIDEVAEVTAPAAPAPTGKAGGTRSAENTHPANPDYSGGCPGG